MKNAECRMKKPLQREQRPVFRKAVPAMLKSNVVDMAGSRERTAIFQEWQGAAISRDAAPTALRATLDRKRASVAGNSAACILQSASVNCYV